VINAWGPYAEASNIAFVDNRGIGVGNMLSATQHCDPGILGCPYQTQHNTYPPSCLGCQYPTPAAAAFVNYPTDLTLKPNSPLRGAGLDGKDLGADLNTVAWATAGAQTGTLSPYLLMKIRAVIPLPGAVQVRFSALDTNACAVEARVYGLPASDPVARYIDNGGPLDRMVTLNGLAGGTHYQLRLSCSGGYYREAEFRTP
jgi:hypothetical protein